MGRDPYKYFRVEAQELLDQLGKGVLDLEKGSGVSDLVPQLLRLAHTLKGAARIVKQQVIADRAHSIEDLFAPFRESGAGPPRDCIDAALKLVDDIGGHVATLQPPAETEGRIADKPAIEEAFRVVRADIAEMDALLDGITETYTQIAALRRHTASAEQARRLAELLTEQRGALRSTERARAGNGVAETKIRAITEELRAAIGGLERNLVSSVDRIDRELRQVRDSAEQLRLIPAGALFTSLERTARDAAQSLGRRVVFEGRGGEVRLDAHVLAAVQGALLQLVRNAVAHGIEPEGARRSARKPSEGRVTLEVVRRGRRVTFRCADDGAGVDLQGVRRAAQRKGLSTTELDRLGVEELLRLLLRGGISTSGTVTEVAGRGIGLDVVREAAERLGGEVGVHTDTGRGTTVELIVPLSLASLDALVVEAAGISAAIPLDAVRRTLRVAAGDIARTAQGESILHDGKAVPFVPLHRMLGGTASPTDGQSWSAVILESSEGTAAVGVARLLGTTNVVLRPIPEFAPATAVVAGASLDAEGTPQLVLDPDGLVAEVRRAGAPPSEPESPRVPVLVVDDSLTTRMLEQSILESAGFEVGMAISGEEALQEARRKRYALFLVDIEMPGMDGFALIERMRADPALRDIPAILVTSRDSSQDRRRGEDVGAQGYIVKSEFDQGEFLARIRQLVQ